MQAVAQARAEAVTRVRELGREDLASDVAVAVTELMTNALLHGEGCTGIEIMRIDDGVRVEVGDRSRTPPVMALESDQELTGRGMRLVSVMAARWGAQPNREGKVVWAELTGEATPESLREDLLLELWDEGESPEPDPHQVRVELGDVPTDLLLAAKSHVDGLVREFALASAGAQAGVTPAVPPHLAQLLDAVVERFRDARVAIKRQALEAARRGAATTRLELVVEPSAAEAAEDYLQALDEIDGYCRAKRLLTLETPAQHRIFREWYISELIAQLRAVGAGQPAPAPQPFQRRLLTEIGRLDEARQASERAARLYAVAAALATAASAEDVATAVLEQGVAALGATAGGVMLAGDTDVLALPGAVGYDESVLAQLRSESRDAELPAAVALRTGEAVWLESTEERDERFPELAGLEAGTVSLCAVPLEVQGRRLGALRFSFDQARLFGEDERKFVLALAAVTAQALARV